MVTVTFDKVAVTDGLLVAVEAGIAVDFVQDNHSLSVKHTLRGLHYQLNKPQGKLVRCTRGEVFDVAVDLRPDSSTRCQWVGAYLSGDNHRQLWIPPGFAHGFLVLSVSILSQFEINAFRTVSMSHL